MEGSGRIDYVKFIFATLFVVSNKLQVIGDQFLDVITTKQWLLLIMIAQYNDQPPTLGQLASLLGTSHQNTKQLALKLEGKGFLVIEKDSQDNRILRFKLTPQSMDYFMKRNDGDIVFLGELFQGLSDEEIKVFAKNIYKLMQNISTMDKSLRSEEFGWIRNLID